MITLQISQTVKILSMIVAVMFEGATSVLAENRPDFEYVRQAAGLSDLDASLRMRNVTMSNDDKPLRVMFDIINEADRPMIVPLNYDYSNPEHYVVEVQAWVQPIELPGIKGPRAKDGEWIIPISGDTLAPGQILAQAHDLSHLKSGQYILTIELKSISTKTIIDEAAVVVQITVPPAGAT